MGSGNDDINKYQDVIDRTPLFKQEWMETIRRMRENPDAPVWNTRCGDRLTVEDLEKIRRFEKTLHEMRYEGITLPPHLIGQLEKLKTRTGWFEMRLADPDWFKNWEWIKPMVRSDLQTRLELVVPLDEDFSRIILNPTSGTTGEPIPAPSHPFAQGCYDPLLKYCLSRHGVQLDIDYHEIAAVQICAQKQTITYNTVHACLEGAGFAKVNILAPEWNDPDRINRYLNSLAPVFLSGDPYAFYLYMKMGLTYRPKALVSTAILLEETLYRQLREYFGCPVINLYSLNETGPIAYSCPVHPEDFHVISPDLFVEITDPFGRILPPGQSGEITVTGGRNPYLPLLRYQTGDQGILKTGNCECGDPMVRITELTGRKLVIFNDLSGTLINPIDISRILREYPVIRHQFVQEKDGSCILNIRFIYDPGSAAKSGLIKKIGELFSFRVPVELKEDLDLSGEKILPYICRMD